MTDDNSFEDAFEEILETVSPVSPPMESVEEIQAIAASHGLENRTSELIHHFLIHHDIDPDSEPPMSILQSGIQVSFSEDMNVEELVDDLITQVFGKALHDASRAEFDSWEGFFKLLHKQGREEIQYVVEISHEIALQNLAGYLLDEEFQKKQDDIFETVFPHLRADPAKVTEVMEDSKSGLVLLLDKDTGEGLERLKRIRERIEENHAKTCVLIKEQPDHNLQGLRNKLLMYGTLARYIVVEHTFASGHLYELPHLNFLDCVVAILQEENEGSTRMADRRILEDDLYELFKYDLDKLEQSVDDAVNWAEEQVEYNSRLNREAHSWYE